MPAVDLDLANAVINICISLDKVASELEKLNKKLNQITYHDSLSIFDVTKP
jgi:hypothetical protein